MHLLLISLLDAPQRRRSFARQTYLCSLQRQSPPTGRSTAANHKAHALIGPLPNFELATPIAEALRLAKRRRLGKELLAHHRSVPSRRGWSPTGGSFASRDDRRSRWLSASPCTVVLRGSSLSRSMGCRSGSSSGRHVSGRSLITVRDKTRSAAHHARSGEERRLTPPLVEGDRHRDGYRYRASDAAFNLSSIKRYRP